MLGAPKKSAEGIRAQNHQRRMEEYADVYGG